MGLLPTRPGEAVLEQGPLLGELANGTGLAVRKQLAGRLDAVLRDRRQFGDKLKRLLG